MSQALFPGFTGDQARLLQADENEGGSQENSKYALSVHPPPAITPLSPLCSVRRLVRRETTRSGRRFGQQATSSG